MSVGLSGIANVFEEAIKCFKRIYLMNFSLKLCEVISPITQFNSANQALVPTHNSTSIDRPGCNLNGIS